MHRTDVAPLHVWQRHHPLARRIADDLRQFPALFGLRSRRLVADIRAKYQTSERIAFLALSFARSP